MKFSEEELKEIYEYIAERLMKEGLIINSKPSTDAFSQKEVTKPAFAPPPERPKVLGNQDAGGHIPESILNMGPGYGGSGHKPTETKL